MTILRKNIQPDGGSYKMRVNASLVNNSVVHKGEQYSWLLLSPQLDKDQEELLDLIWGFRGLV